MGRSREDESQEDVLMDEAPSNISQASTLQANREGKTFTHQIGFWILTALVPFLLNSLTASVSRQTP